MQVQSFWFWKILQEIIYFFIVNLKKWAVYPELGLCFFMCFNFIEKFINRSWNNTSKVLISSQILKKSVLPFGIQIFRYHGLPITTKHGISFARTSLTIGKYSHVKPFRNFADRRNKLIKNLSLSSLLTECKIKLSLQNIQSIRSDVDSSTLNYSLNMYILFNGNNFFAAGLVTD